MAACLAISRTRSATDCGSMIVAQTSVSVFQAHRPKVCAPLAQKKKWAKTHRTNPKIRASCGLYEKDRAEASEGQDGEVSTGSGSDRVSIHVMIDITETMTRSLPLPVLTRSSSSIGGVVADLGRRI